MEAPYNITGGIYLVINPAVDKNVLLPKLAAALNGGLQVVQIWNNWLPDTNKLHLIEDIAQLCIAYKVPLFINEEWQLLTQTPYLQGVHFDAVPDNYDAIKQTIGKPFLSGITCSGNLDTVRWANDNQLGYVSFCAMFPSPSAGSCDIVMPATVRQAKEIINMPLFVSGGITPENIALLKKETPFDGVAVISGILSAADPQLQVQYYKDALSIKS